MAVPAPGRVAGRPMPMGQPRDSKGRYISTRWFWFVLGVLLALGMIADGGLLAV